MSHARDILHKIGVDIDKASAAETPGDVTGAGIDTELQCPVVEFQINVTAVSGTITAIVLEDDTDAGFATALADVAGTDAVRDINGAEVTFPISATGKYFIRSDRAHRQFVRSKVTVAGTTMTFDVIAVRSMPHRAVENLD